MVCPNCKSENQFVIDSRPGPANTIRRRRHCKACQHRWTTYECEASTMAQAVTIEDQDQHDAST